MDVGRAKEIHATYEGGLTIVQAAAAHSLSPSTVIGIFKRFGLPIRSKGEASRMKPTIAEAVDDSSLLAFKSRWDALDTTVKGSIAEGHVRTKLAELGLDVWEPCSQNHRTDFVVLSNSRVTRIQVKCATYDVDRKRFRCNLHRRHRGGTHSVYAREDVDFFIVYCAGLPMPEFYVIPETLIGGVPSINLLPHRARQANFSEFSWEQYRGAFRLLEPSNDETPRARFILRGRRRGSRV